ncbi:MAG: Gfo/Idh/MocA family protein [Mycobacteriales bacterium]
MTTTGPTGVGIIGAGVISKEYLENLTTFPDVKVVAIGDIETDRAKAQAEKYDIPVSGDADAVLNRDDIDVVVNLTIPAVHVQIAKDILSAGKHAYGEKPLTLDLAAGKELLADADKRGLRVGCAPDTFLGSGIQTALRLIKEGAIGEPQSALTSMQSPGPESWHPSPEFLFAKGGGPVLDIGPYYFTCLVQLLVPIARVGAVGSTAKHERVIGSGPKAGTRFPVEVPTNVFALAEFATGNSATMIMSFDSPLPRAGIVEITGTEATLKVPDPNTFTGTVQLYPLGGKDWEDRNTMGTTCSRGIGVLDMVQAIREDRPHRASGELALHVFDAMASTEAASGDRDFRTLTTTCTAPEPLGAAWDPQKASA